MSAHNAPIYFDDKPRVDEVTFAVVPYDSFSGRVVANGVKAAVDGLLDRPIRNFSGHLVFINLPLPLGYGVTIDASDAGYLSPVHATFPSDHNPAAARRLMVPLTRLPSFPYAEATTLIRGVVVRDSGTATVPVSDASIWVAASANARFNTTSDERGAFALPLSRPAHGHPGPYTVTLHLEKGEANRQFDVEINEGKSHSFKEPIKLPGNNTPEFFDPNQP
ncbi:carboxypeptidase regulatory-like domain-containing protein [Bradyrhizobium japonicum]|uniref:carboxypeptidase-like regulatory domain-containing protein n=1 Tax=Bradyrhizobium japonicum TaxID=375 RepID=UPI001BA46878|nr:carboxypeptidase-like regulatory domain-containing protein [Bradyrhizobium japonicum]MBR0804350.1 carboxypeptidase regulatory-like domain-containing protein [Bradyrhizobium japonicum]